MSGNYQHMDALHIHRIHGITTMVAHTLQVSGTYGLTTYAGSHRVSPVLKLKKASREEPAGLEGPVVYNPVGVRSLSVKRTDAMQRRTLDRRI
jgi:hypothetical protein